MPASGDATVRNQHGVLRAALAQAVRSEWTSSNVALLARLRSTKTPPRHEMTLLTDVEAVIVAAALIDPATELALRLAAVAGARRAELAALQWNDVHEGC
jgi:integrase